MPKLPRKRYAYPECEATPVRFSCLLCDRRFCCEHSEIHYEIDAFIPPLHRPKPSAKTRKSFLDTDQKEVSDSESDSSETW